MYGRYLAVLLICIPVAAQEGLRQPQFPPDIIAHDSPIRDLAKLDAEHVAVETENDRVRVLRIRLGAKESLPMHDARDGVLVCVKGCVLTVTNPVGYTKEIKLKAGQTEWMRGARHRISSATPTEFLYIEAKRVQ